MTGIGHERKKLFRNGGGLDAADANASQIRNRGKGLDHCEKIVTFRLVGTDVDAREDNFPNTSDRERASLFHQVVERPVNAPCHEQRV